MTPLVEAFGMLPDEVQEAIALEYLGGQLMEITNKAYEAEELKSNLLVKVDELRGHPLANALTDHGKHQFSRVAATCEQIVKTEGYGE